MKILVLSNRWPPCDLGSYGLAAANVTRGLAERGHEVMVGTSASHLSRSNAEDYVRRTLRLTWFSPYPVRDNETERKELLASATGQYEHGVAVLAMIRTFKPDLVYCFDVFAAGGLSIFDLLDIVGVPRVVHLTNKLPEFIFTNIPAALRPLYGRALGGVLRATPAIAMSEHLIEEIKNDAGFTFDTPATIIPGWVDTDNLSLRTAYLDDGIARFVTAGAVVPHKGIGLIIEAAAVLLAQGQSNFTIDVYGEGEISTFIERSNVMGVSSKIRFLGARRQAELLALYSHYDALLFPAWEKEPFGFVPVEAAACGCIPIMTRNCGASERFVDLVHCVKIERSPAQIAAAMLEVMTGALDLEAMGLAASQMVRRDLSFDKCLHEIEVVLETAAASGWDTAAADDEKLPLLLYAKDQLALGLAYGYQI